MVFLNSFFTVVITSACVLSICVGIIGYLSLWGIDLDPIFMAALIISIGCSIDIPTHVAYHYFQACKLAAAATGHNNQRSSHLETRAPIFVFFFFFAATKNNPNGDNSLEYKLANCLSSVAFPAIQAGISTTLCVCSLLFVHLYMSEVFVKTMAVCVLLCNLHGLIFLPAFLIIFDKLWRWLKRRVGALKIGSSTANGNAAGRGGGGKGGALGKKQNTASTTDSSGGGGNGVKRSGARRNSNAPDAGNRVTDRPSVSSSREPSPTASQPRASPRPALKDGTQRHTLAPAEPRQTRFLAPVADENDDKKAAAEKSHDAKNTKMTTIDLNEPPSSQSQHAAAAASNDAPTANGRDAGAASRRPPLVKKQSAIVEDEPATIVHRI